MLRYNSNRSMGRSPFHRGPANYQVNAKDGEILLYDEIGFWGITAEEFVRDLDALKTDEVLVRINSPGGEVFDGTAIYNAIRQDSRRIVTQIDGLAASMASAIAMAGDEVRMADNAFLMIHNPWSLMWGDAEDLRKEADLLEKIGLTLAGSYSGKTGIKIETIMELMGEETWYTGVEAKDAGFIDVMFTDTEADEPEALFDLSVFGHVPAAMKRKIESNLRDAGFSKAAAKRAVSKGFQTLHRDDAATDHREDGSEIEIETALDAVIENVKLSIRN